MGSIPGHLNSLSHRLESMSASHDFAFVPKFLDLNILDTPGANLGQAATHLAQHGVNLRLTWVNLGPTWANLRSTWPQHGLNTDQDGPTWLQHAQLGLPKPAKPSKDASKIQLGVNLGQLGTNLELTWANLVPTGANLGQFATTWG